MEKIDAFIPCSPKDRAKLDRAVLSLVRNFKELGDVHVCVPDKTGFDDWEAEGHSVVFHEDFEVLPVPGLVKALRFRPNWIFQQWLKLFQRVTTDVCLTWDADCFLTAPTSAYGAGGRLKLFVQPNESDEAAFARFSAKATGGVLGEWTDCDRWPTQYIADMALFSRKWIDEMVLKFFPSANDFLSFSALNTYWRRDDTRHAIFLSEYQLVGEYEQKFHGGEVETCRLRKRQLDRNQMSQRGSMWSEEEVEAEIAKAEADDTEILKLQSNSPMHDVGWRVPGSV